jgi:MtN3 and saliva related transmembrane protein
MFSPEKLQLSLLVCTVMILAGCAEWAIHDTESLLFPRFRVAGLGTTFAALPDLIAMLKRRSSKGMNPRMAGAFPILWVYYGLLIGSRPVALWNIIAVVTNFFSVGAYYHFARRERGHP